ncbi:hypothetical protein DL93DRAFT_1500187 [Clavulina sp. PMI_390]|nr:hypothetical protein DL93DRAFT_1500187 [Clavulina sp. PMI_390]
MIQLRHFVISLISSFNFRRLLKLLVLLNKYQASAYEEFVWGLIEPMTSTDGLKKHTSPEFNAIEVIRLARKANRQKLAHSAGQILARQLWAKDPKASPYDSLLFSEEVEDLALRGAAYYQVMLLGQAAWDDSRLSERHRQNLMTGLLRSAEEWNSFTRAWNNPEQLPHPFVHKECLRLAQRSERNKHLAARLWATLGQHNIVWFDVIGKLGLVMNEALLDISHYEQGVCDQSRNCRAQYGTAIGNMRQNLHAWFEPPNAVVTSAS